MVCDILSSIELVTRETAGLRYIGLNEILAKAPEATRKSPAPLQIPVAIEHAFAGGRQEQMNLRLTPDGLFGLEYESAGSKSYRFFALEADRGTMPAVRGTLRQSSFLRKILGYREVLTRKLYRTHLGVPNLLALTVTTNEFHLRTIARLAGDICGDGMSKGLLFKSLSGSTEPVWDILSTPWQRPDNSHFDMGVP